jgi:hypothetical protein
MEYNNNSSNVTRNANVVDVRGVGGGKIPITLSLRIVNIRHRNHTLHFTLTWKLYHYRDLLV